MFDFFFYMNYINWKFLYMGFDDEDSGAFTSLFSSFLLLLVSFLEVLLLAPAYLLGTVFLFFLFSFSFHFSVPQKNSMNIYIYIYIYIQALYICQIDKTKSDILGKCLKFGRRKLISMQREKERERPGCILVKVSHMLDPFPSWCAAPSYFKRNKNQFEQYNSFKHSSNNSYVNNIKCQ